MNIFLDKSGIEKEFFSQAKQKASKADEDDLDGQHKRLALEQKSLIFDYLKKYLTCTTIFFGVIIIISFFHYPKFYIDGWAFRIISTVFPTQAVALVYLIVRHLYPKADRD